MDKPSSSRPPLPATDYDQDEDAILSNSEFLTRDEVLKRRVRRLRRLSKFYRDCYWLLMEDVRIKHREYVWKYGKSPCIEENGDVIVVKRENGDIGDEVLDNNVDNGDKLGLGSDVNFKRCAFSACSAKAMALTNYCVAHIVMDTKQVLYKRCKSPQTVLKRFFSFSHLIFVSIYFIILILIDCVVNCSLHCIYIYLVFFLKRSRFMILGLTIFVNGVYNIFTMVDYNWKI